MRTPWSLPRAILLVSLLLVVVGRPGPVQAQTRVEVVNVPEVRVPEPIPHTRIERFLEVPISPGTGDGDRWTLVGEVETDGYPRLMLSLGGEVVGGNHRGVVGAVLVPAEVFPKKALCNKGLAPFALRAEAQEKGDTGLFASEPFSLPVSFPKYEVYLFNAGEKPVKANLYVYLTQ